MPEASADIPELEHFKGSGAVSDPDLNDYVLSHTGEKLQPVL